MLCTASPEELRAAAVYRELLRVALAELANRDAEIRRLETRLAHRVEEIRRYVAAKVCDSE